MTTDRELLAAAYREAAGQPIFAPALDALMSVVDRIATARAAAELHKAADDWRNRDQNTDLWLRSRAYALDPT